MSKTSTKTIQESETKSKLNRYQILDFQIELIMTLCQLRKSAIQFLYQAQCCLFYTECSAIDNQLFLSWSLSKSVTGVPEVPKLYMHILDTQFTSTCLLRSKLYCLCCVLVVALACGRRCKRHTFDASKLETKLTFCEIFRVSYSFTWQKEFRIKTYVILMWSLYRGIHADVIVYIFAHLHTTLRTEENLLGVYWLQATKDLVKLKTWLKF